MGNNFRYTLKTRLGNRIATPRGENDFTKEYARNTDGKAGYTEEMPAQIVFVEDDFRLLYKIERSIYRCDFIGLDVEKECVVDGVSNWEMIFSGRFSLNGGQWSPRACKVSIRLDNIQTSQCLEENMDVDVDILDTVPVANTVDVYAQNITIETVQYENSCTVPPLPGCSDNPWSGTGTPQEGQWIIFYRYNRRQLGGYRENKVGYARQVLTLPCEDEPTTPDWVLIESTCPGGNKKYARPATLYAPVFKRTTDREDNSLPNGTTITETSYQIVGDVGSVTELNNGRSVREVMDMYLNRFCPGMLVRSQFFQWNPLQATPINYVTNARSKVMDLVMFQKSDVKRQSADDATDGNMTLEEFLNMLIVAFNMEWWIEDGVFNIEHVSYRNRNVGLNLTLPRYAERVSGKTNYSYDEEEIPVRDEFLFMEASDGDFKGVPIVYTTCISRFSRSNVGKYTIENVTTDVELVMNNPAPDSSAVSDEGFVLVATMDGHIITEGGIFGAPKLNNSLAWAQLQRDYYRHNRPVGRGMLNNQPVTFLSTIPTKKGETLAIELCCGDVFNPDDYILTELGVGVVDKATYRRKDNMLLVDLLYDAEDGLVENTAPTAVNDLFNVPQDLDAILDVLANDIESDAGGSFSAIDIVFEPLHGTVSITPELKVLYTPPPAFTGNDQFVYRAVDDWGEESNEALVVINVFQQDGPPVAINDNYQTFAGQSLAVSSPGVLGNDASNNGLSLSTYDANTVNGGTVIMANDGSFTYNPPAGYTGADTFTYTIINNLNLSDTATVTIQVVAATNPIAVNDTFNTDSNNVLQVSAPGVLANDLTGAGTLSVVPASGATVQGGTFVINADGSFTYNRPSGIFSGTDSFQYTATNGTGTATATVNINVFPNIFARLHRPENERVLVPIMRECNGQMIARGSTIYYNVYVQFFSDAAGTQPMNVTPFNISVNYRIFNYSSQTEEIRTKVASPANNTFLLEGNYKWETRPLTCAGGRDDGDTWHITLAPGAYTII